MRGTRASTNGAASANGTNGHTPPHSWSISDNLLAYASHSRSKKQTLGTDIWSIPKPPPGVVPKNARTMALDESITDNFAWAQSFLGSTYDEGLVFLGYPYLAALAQRPEYRRLSEVIASEATREWIEIYNNGEDDKSDQIAQLEDAMKRLDAQNIFRRLAEQDGFFGRAHLFIDLGVNDFPDELRTSIGYGRDETSLAKIRKGSLKALRVVEPVWCYPNHYNSTDPLAGNWYKPVTWFVMSREIHASRLLTFVAREVPDVLKPVYSFGGVSLTQLAKPYVENWLRTRSAVGDLVASFATNGVKMNLAALLQREGEQMVFNRAEFYNQMRDNRGLMLLDKETEEFFQFATPLSGLDKLQAQAQEHICSISGLPLIKYTGITPSGLNASSEGELRSFYDWIAAYQDTLFRENLTRVLDIVQLSEFGAIDPDIQFRFKSLWQLDEAGRATVAQTKANTHKSYIDMGAVSKEEVRDALANDDDSLYTGLDLSQPLPEPAQPMLPGMPGEPMQPPQPANAAVSGSEERAPVGRLPGGIAEPSPRRPLQARTLGVGGGDGGAAGFDRHPFATRPGALRGTRARRNGSPSYH